ncbi:flagellar assembly protein FliW [Microbacterium sp. NPDC008134]|jgi:flagellar assembly factor FliW|uniref:flagellar assembly protein FliW n=1 Tax=Microbacterium sp. NPDC008134 TaxID=3364183 RepID=UPI0036E6412D
MTATTARAGIEPTAPVIEFAAPLLGLAPHTTFTLESIAGADGLHALRTTDADVRLFVLEAPYVDRAYAPKVPASVRAELGASAGDALQVLVVANPGEDGVHVNLRAPIVVHPGTGRAAQVILEDQAYPIRSLLGGR